MANSFTPSRLTLARKRRGLTKKALADAITVSYRIITAYEAETRRPKASTVEKIARQLNFPISFFSTHEVDTLPIEGTSFRSLKKMSARVRDQAMAAGELAFDLSNWLDKKFTNFPKPNIPKLQGVDPETASEIVRREWGLGELSIRNLVHLLELHGVRVFSLAEEYREVDAYSCWHQGKPFIFLNTIKTAERSRMDAAHELGHLALHWHDVIPQRRDIEQEAKMFASAFLMPKGSILANAPYGATINQIIRSKHNWGVSALALVVRMHRLGLLTDWQYRLNCIEIGRIDEPEAMSERETSQILSKVFNSLRNEGISKADIARELCLPVEELNKLIFGLTPLTTLKGDGEQSIERAEKPVLKLI